MRPATAGALAAGAVLIVVMVAVVVYVAAGDDPAAITTSVAPSSTVATSTTSATAPTTTTAPAATTTAPTTTTTTAPTTTTTAPPTTTTTVVAPDEWVVRSWGIDGPGEDLVVGMSPDDAVGTGLMVYDGPDFTVEDEGFYCGFGESSAPFPPAAFFGMFLEPGLARIYITAPLLRTEDGLGVGSLVADVEAMLGPADDDFPGHYVPTERHLLYDEGDTGFLFVSEDGTVTRMSVGTTAELYLVEGCL